VDGPPAALGALCPFFLAAGLSAQPVAWTSAPMIIAYIFASLALAFFVCGVRKVRFPFAGGDDADTDQQVQDAQLTGFGSSTSTAPIGSAKSPPSVMSQVHVKHFWCVKCEFPFPRPQTRATCKVDRPGENWCARRRSTTRGERLRRMVQNPNTLYRVHPAWRPELVPDAD